MTDIDSHSNGDASLALATYLEPLLRRRRVLLVASPESALTASLAAVAEAVQVVAPEELSIRGSHQNAELELTFDEEDFDLVWVTDVASLPDPRARAVDAFSNALAPDGALVLCARADASLKPRKRRSRGKGGGPADALHKLASQAFEDVLLLTQSPFDGFAIDAPDAPDGGTALDQSLVGRHDVAPLWHVAVAADELPELEARLVVRVAGGESSQAGDDSERVADLERQLDALGREADGLRVEAADLDDALESALARAEKAEDAAQVAKQEVRELERRRRKDRDELDRARDKLRALARDLEAATARTVDVDELEALREEASDLEQRLVEAGAKVVDLEAEVERRGEIARDLMVDLERMREQAEEAAASAEPPPAAAASELAGSALLGRDSERVRAMGAELLTYRQQAGERDALSSELDEAREQLRVERARSLGMSMRLEEAERALERHDADGATAEEVTDLHEAVGDSEARVRQLGERLAEAHRQVEQLQREATQMSAGSSLDEGEREKLSQALTDAQQRAADLEQALRESDDTLEALRADLRNREQGLEQTRRERDEARAGLEEARALLQQAASLQEPPSS